MKKIFIMLLTCFFFGACGSLNKQKLTESTLKTQTASFIKYETVNNSSITLKIDSGTYSVEVEVLPVDVVQFSPTSGFVGKASKISFKSTEQKAGLFKEAVQQVSANHEEVKVVQEESKEVTIKTKATAKINFWMLGFFVVLGFLMYCVYNYFKRGLIFR